MARKTLSPELVDFSKPWDPFVDVTLLVEGRRFHAHRNILGLWSPVFSRMFTADFREKTAQQIPLPGKKANDINELLLVIYPTSAKPIDDRNFELLLHLYMMTKLTEKCEAYLMEINGRNEKKNARDSLSPRVSPSRAFFFHFAHLFPSACYAG